MAESLIFSALIVIARVADVSLGTLRTVSLIRGRKLLATFFGFFESMLWLLVVAKVATSLNEPIYIVAYATGFALGNYVGLSIEQHIGMGQQVIRIITRSGSELTQKLRTLGHRVTTFQGNGRDGEVTLVMVKTARRATRELVSTVKEIDQSCFLFIDDVSDGVVESSRRPSFLVTGWRARGRKK